MVAQISKMNAPESRRVDGGDQSCFLQRDDVKILGSDDDVAFFSSILKFSSTQSKTAPKISTFLSPI